MRRIAIALVLILAATAAGAQTSWVAQARTDLGRQLPPSPYNAAVLAYRTPVSWPYGASEKRELPPIFGGRELITLPIPREFFASEEAYRRYYLDHPRRGRLPAPPLTEVPDLHRPRPNCFEIPFPF